VVPVAPGITLIAAGQPRCIMTVNGDKGGLTLRAPGRSEPEVLYPGRVERLPDSHRTGGVRHLLFSSKTFSCLPFWTVILSSLRTL
jgi:hypothetical protein